MPMVITFFIEYVKSINSDYNVFNDFYNNNNVERMDYGFKQ